MVSFCSAVNCSKGKKKHPELSYFKVPKDQERAKKWIVNSQRAGLLTRNLDYCIKNIGFCADHFEDCMFMNGKKNRLIRSAVPTIFDLPNLPRKEQLKTASPQQIIDKEPGTTIPQKIVNEEPASEVFKANI